MIGSIKLFGVVTEGILVISNGFGDQTFVAKRIGELEMSLSKGPLELNIAGVNFSGSIQMGESFFKPG